LRTPEDLFGRAGFGDPATVKKENAVGHVTRELHLVSDHNHGHTFLGQALHHGKDITDQLRRPRNSGLEAAFVPYGQKSFKIWLIEGKRRDGAANV